MLFRLAYLGVTNGLALLRLLPMSDRDKDAEILVLRHQITVLERQLHGQGYRVRFAPADRVGDQRIPPGCDHAIPPVWPVRDATWSSWWPGGRRSRAACWVGSWVRS